MSSTLTRTKAKHWTLAAQGAALVLLVAGVALGVTGLPEQSLPTAAVVEEVNGPAKNGAKPGKEPVLGTHVEVASLAERLSMVDNAPKLPEVEVVVETTKDPIQGEDDEENGEIPKRLRFIGYVAEGSNHAAFVRLDGVQRIVREGGMIISPDENLSDLTIKTIRPKYIVATDDKGEARVLLGTRTGQTITMANGNEITPAKVAPDDAKNYDERILGDPSRVPEREIERRRRTLDRALRGEQSRSEEARLREPPVQRTTNLRTTPTRERRGDD